MLEEMIKWIPRRDKNGAMDIPLVQRDRLQSLKGIHKDKRAFILGNGPSLAQCDLTLIADEVTIASNGIFLLYDSTIFRPTFYTVEDRLVAEDRKEQINQLTGSTKIIPWDLAKFIESDDDLVYVNFIRNYRGFPKFASNFAKKVYWGGTVTYLNLQLAFYLGCKEIFLIGMDHNYLPPSDGDQKSGNVITSATNDANHFDPKYFGPGFRWHDPNVDRMETAYVEAGKFLKSRGISVYNASVGGKLELFPRVDYYSLFD